MQALVTGGGGFIGSNIARALLERGDSVRVVDDFSTGREVNLEGVDVEVVRGSIEDRDTVDRAMRDVEVVFHQAALPSVKRSVDDPGRTHAVNATGTLNVLDAARAAGVRRFVYASSSSAYGDTPVLPKREDMVPSPLSPYAVSKLAGEHYCKAFTKVYGLECVALRYFNVYGPRQDPTSHYSAVIPLFATALLTGATPTVFGDGEQTRDFTYIDNVVRANLLAAEAGPQVAGEAMNIACGERVSLNELLSAIAEVVGLEDFEAVYRDPRPGDVRDSLADITKAQTLIGYVPEVRLSEGLKRTVEWFS
ncbi:MAG: SDR family oxidoreductase [Acidimicrobiia bacterium]|nr:SDR family oxidoreductase [Acidimicrobiia bacterium]MDH4309022.1 SDR family oxidoreductase [Acidimicrobiia bacterium]